MREGWQLKSLGAVADFKGGGTPSTEMPDYWNGEIPWVSPKDMKTDQIGSSIDRITLEAVKNSAASIIPTGSILIVVRSGILARTIPTAITTRELTVNQDIKAICPHSGLDGNYLHYFLRSAEKHILSLVTTGATVHRLITENIKSLQLPLPPLPEQKRIVAILDEAFEGIDAAVANTEKNLASARELFETSLQAVFARRGAEWERITLEALLERGWIESHLDGNHGGDYPRKEEFISAGVPYISATCIFDGHIDMARAKHLAPSRAALLRKGIARDKDVIFAHNATVGPVAVLRTDQEKVILGTSLTYYRCNEKHILPEYLAHFMRSSIFKSQYLQIMRQSTRNQVPITKQREFYHVVPSIAEQRIVVKQLDCIFENGRRLEAIYQQKLDAFVDLKQSVLNKAFAGQLAGRSVRALSKALE